jgi:hypothetical protein
MVYEPHNSRVHCPSWMDDSHAFIEAFPTVYGTCMFYCHLEKSFLLGPVLSQVNWFTVRQLYFFKIHFNIILPHIPRFPQLCLLFRFLDENLYKFLTSPTVRYLPRVLFRQVEFYVEKYHEHFLSGSGVTMAWNILRLQLEDTTSRYAM